MTAIVDKLDDWGRPAWIATMVVSFIVFWPIGLAVLGYMIWSGRMGCRSQRKMRDGVESFKAWGRGGAMPSSGNHAFDEYRMETLRRLEEEQQEFKDFLKRLRMAKDRAEFDQFMASRRDDAAAGPTSTAGGPTGGPMGQTGSTGPTGPATP
ncbi:MAG: DUF2852 domain-containing protein [Pseudomonadota bacterium]